MPSARTCWPTTTRWSHTDWLAATSGRCACPPPLSSITAFTFTISAPNKKRGLPDAKAPDHPVGLRRFASRPTRHQPRHRGRADGQQKRGKEDREVGIEGLFRLPHQWFDQSPRLRNHEE